MPPPQPLGMQITANITPHAPHFSHSFAPPLVPGGFAPPSPPLGAHPSALPSRTRCGAGAAYPDPEAHAAMHFVRPDVHARGSHAPAQRSPHGHRSPAIASVSVPDLRIAHRRCPISPYSSPSPPGIAHGRGPVSPYSSPSPPSGPRWSPDGLSHSQSARVLSDGVGGTPRSARVHRTHSDTWGPPSPDKAQRVFKPSSKYSLPKHWRSPTKYFDRPSRAQFRSKTEPPTRNSEPEGLSSGGLALAPDPLDILAARQSVDIPLARKSVDIPVAKETFGCEGDVLPDPVCSSLGSSEDLLDHDPRAASPVVVPPPAPKQQVSAWTLCEKAFAGDLPGLRALFAKGHDMSVCDYDQRTALHLAAAGGHLDIVKFLLEEADCPMFRDRFGHLPMYDAERNSHTAVHQYLQDVLRRRQQPMPAEEEEDSNHKVEAWTLCDKAFTGDLAGLRVLYTRGQNMAIGDYDQRTALHLAAAAGHMPIVQFLVEEVGCPIQRDRFGGLPHHDADKNGHASVSEYLINAARRQGVELGDDRRRGMDAWTLCELACAGDLLGLRQMHAEGQDLAVCDYDQRTPLHLAAAAGHLAIVQFLMEEAGCTPEQDRFGYLPIHDAQRNGHQQVQEYLQAALFREDVAKGKDLWSPESSSPPVLSHSFSSRSFVGTPTTPALSAESCGSSYCDEFDESFLSGTVVLTIHEANHLPSAGFLKTNKYNPYVRIVVNGTKARRTSAVKNNQNPIWEETFDVELVGDIPSIHFHVKHRDSLQSESFGKLELPIQSFLHTPIQRRWYPLVMTTACDPKPVICLSAHYTCTSQTLYTSEVPYCAFPQRTACGLRLYADAHLDPEHPRPPVPTAEGTYRNLDLWNEMYTAIQDAKKFIYIAGWSVWTDLYMIREPVKCPSLGDLLKQKAAQGVCVRVLLWNDATSVDNSVVNALLSKTKSGLMGTHHIETAQFFHKSGVICELVKCHSQGVGHHTHGTNTKISWLNSKMGHGKIFTHHQKTVSMDAPSLDSTDKRRRVISFVGGLDLTNGRYDTPEHPLFDTLKTVHSGDFRQQLGGFDSRFGPRQPWHDCHAMVEGRAARDVVKNFEQRWRKQASSSNRSRLFDFSRHVHDVLPKEIDLVPRYRAWHVQMFRSIDHNSAEGVGTLERDIARAYCYQIRRAQRFIYVENQYFMGSSKWWEGFTDSTNNIPCKHRVPYELAMRIVSKIRTGQRFTVYICIPLYPEGDPQSVAMQAVLCWQSRTLQMMYSKVAEALARWGPADAHPCHYLNVYCLAKREQCPVRVDLSMVRNPRQQQLIQTGRQMVYVHSKLMVCDDEYLMIGSANINHRSLGGDRDTEIALGCVEAAHLKQPDGPVLPQGQVFGFRASLWGEHLGHYDPLFVKPHSLECVRRVNELAEANWEAFVGPAVRPLPHGHLLKYPYTVARDGALGAKVESFPDMAAGVMGSRPPDVLNLLTT